MSEQAARGDDEMRAFPVLPSLNIAETRAFYEKQLAFTNIVHEHASYLIIARDNLEIHFWRTDDASICKSSSVYIRGGGIDRLYREFADRNIRGLSRFEEKEWGMKEFYLIDPHGNLLRFGRIP